MSVTFAPDTSKMPMEWGITCHLVEDNFIHAGPTYDHTLAARAAHLLECEECKAWGSFSTSRPVGVGEVPEVNMANTNARDILGRLGLDTQDIWGSEDADTFLARCMMTEAVEDYDEGIRPAHLNPGEGGARVIDAGRRPGYVQDRLTRLVEIATWAKEHGVAVTWA